MKQPHKPTIEDLAIAGAREAQAMNDVAAAMAKFDEVLKETEDRDEAIRAARDAGAPLDAIAAKVDLSVSRVQQIVDTW